MQPSPLALLDADTIFEHGQLLHVPHVPVWGNQWGPS